MATHRLADLDGRTVTVEAPASSANLGAGYDCLGVALAMTDRVEVEVRSWSRGVVELTAFHQPDRHRYVVSLVNFQKDLPNIPVEGIEVRVRLPRESIDRVTRLPDGDTIEHTTSDGVVAFRAPRLDTLAMFAIATR